MSEYTTVIKGMRISVDQGGTYAYEGDWTVTVENGPEYVFDNETINTGPDSTHEDVALIAYAFASRKVDWEAAAQTFMTTADTLV